MEKLNRSSLAQQIAEQIIGGIYAGKFKPSSMLPSENELSAQYEVSRPVVREALQYLIAQGFIEIIRGKGSYVQEVNDKPLRLFFKRAINADPNAWIALEEVREPLEKKSAFLAAQRRTDDELVVLEEIIQEITAYKKIAQEQHRYEEYASLDVKFHVEVAKTSKNDFLFHLINSIRQSLTAMNIQLLSSCLHSYIPLLVDAHREIFEAIRDGEPRKAEEAMHKHYELVYKGIRIFQETKTY